MPGSDRDRSDRSGRSAEAEKSLSDRGTAREETGISRRPLQGQPAVVSFFLRVGAKEEGEKGHGRHGGDDPGAQKNGKEKSKAVGLDQKEKQNGSRMRRK